MLLTRPSKNVYRQHRSLADIHATDAHVRVDIPAKFTMRPRTTAKQPAQNVSIFGKFDKKKARKISGLKACESYR
jgi:hypothetical protein